MYFSVFDICNYVFQCIWYLCFKELGFNLPIKEICLLIVILLICFYTFLFTGVSQNETLAIPLNFQVDPEGFYLSARCERDKVSVFVCCYGA